MFNIKKTVWSFVIALFCAVNVFSFVSVASAQETKNEFSGIIPAQTSVASNDKLDCFVDSTDAIKNDTSKDKVQVPNPAYENDLGAKIYCGTVSLNDIPALIIYLIQWIMSLIGGLCVIMIMIGGVQYMLGGVTDDKEQGKKTVIYAIGGLITAMFAWIIVELIQVWLTS